MGQGQVHGAPGQGRRGAHGALLRICGHPFQPRCDPPGRVRQFHGGAAHGHYRRGPCAALGRAIAPGRDAAR